MPPDGLALIRRARAEAKAELEKRPAGMQSLPSLGLEGIQVDRLLAPLPNLPATAVYYPDFISEADEAILVQYIQSAPAVRWTPGTGRRTQNWGGRPGERLVTEPLPTWLAHLVDALVRSGAWPAAEAPPNHVIINDYEQPGAGLTPHTDGPLYAARVATLSLLSDVVVELHRPEDAAVACEADTRLGRLLLRRRSLNVLSGDAYRCFHGIPWAESDVVDESIANLHQAGSTAALGTVVHRGRRMSIVFVSKLAQ